jgi:two-component system, NtrC family, response regulator PilR
MKASDNNAMNLENPQAASMPSATSSARSPRVLIVDDEADLRELLELTLVGMGLDVDSAVNLAQAKALARTNHYQLCLTDMRLPDGLGLSIVEDFTARGLDTPVAVITAYGSAENAVAALKAGAFDYLSKPVGLDSLRNLVRSALSSQAAAAVAPAASIALAATSPLDAMLGHSAAMQEVRSTVLRLARSMAPVAITGESGSGKELAARMIHATGARAQAPFVAVNCGAIPEALMESEFFGHKKGAFTGADVERVGFFQAANGGTLFLDEVADLPLAMQVKLLRAIQEKRVRKIGAVQEELVDVRIVSATHQDLAQCVSAGRFRQDLYYRLNVIALRLPALRERRDDIGALAQAILAKVSKRAGLDTPPTLSSMTLKYLQTYDFPGNVRELENLLERALAFSDGLMVNVEDLGLQPDVSLAAMNEPYNANGEPLSHDRAAPFIEQMRDAGHLARVAMGAMTFSDELTVTAAAAAEAALLATRPSVPLVDGVPESLPDYLDQLEREAIHKALSKTRFNRTAAAKLLGISFRALRYRMQRLEIQ